MTPRDKTYKPELLIFDRYIYYDQGTTTKITLIMLTRILFVPLPQILLVVVKNPNVSSLSPILPMWKLYIIRHAIMTSTNWLRRSLDSHDQVISSNERKSYNRTE
jgi:hypothetical protein